MTQIRSQKCHQMDLIMTWMQGKYFFCEQEVRTNEQDDARLARFLKDNEVQEGIKMEAEFPSNDMNGKMAILDMSVWMDSDNNIVYEHYQKSVASKQKKCSCAGGLTEDSE